LRAAPGAALFLAHEKRSLCERINAYLGRTAVAQLKFSPGRAACRPPAAPKRRKPGRPAAGDPSRAIKGPEGLTKALADTSSSQNGVARRGNSGRKVKQKRKGRLMSRKTWTILGVLAVLLVGGGTWYVLRGDGSAPPPPRAPTTISPNTT
jgi:hypothetical protein